jgi:hypothetical protein
LVATLLTLLRTYFINQESSLHLNLPVSSYYSTNDLTTMDVPGGQQGGDEAVITDQEPAAVDANMVLVQALQTSLAAGQITMNQFIAAAAALGGISTPSTVATGGHLVRAQAPVGAEMDQFRGDRSDILMAGRWIDAFERTADRFHLDRRKWAIQAVDCFPANSAAALWAASIFGVGLQFRCESWGVFRTAFLTKYTPDNALINAQESFEQLTQDTFGEDVIAFNREFNVRAMQYNTCLRDAGSHCLQLTELLRAYQMKLRGGARAQIDAIICINAMMNRERRMDGRPDIALGIQDLLAETETFALQRNLGHGGGAAREGRTITTTGNTTMGRQGGPTLMELDMLKEENSAMREELNAIKQSLEGRGKWGSMGPGGGMRKRVCWNCGKMGHTKANCSASNIMAAVKWDKEGNVVT